MISRIGVVLIVAAVSFGGGCIPSRYQAYTPAYFDFDAERIENDWIRLVPPEGTYRFAMPGSPAVQYEHRETQRGPMHQMKFDLRTTSESGIEVAYIAYVFTRRLEDMKPESAELRYQEASVAVSLEGATRDTRQGEAHGRAAREFIVHGFRDGLYVAPTRVVLDGQRIFWFMVVLPESELARSSRQIAYFFDSWMPTSATPEAPAESRPE